VILLTRGYGSPSFGHASEAIDNIPRELFDAVIVNDGAVEELYAKGEEAVK